MAYFVLWGCMPVARGPALLPAGDGSSTQHSIELGAGDLGELSTALYGGMQYTFLRPIQQGRNWAYGGRLIGNAVQIEHYPPIPTAGLGLIARRHLWDSDLSALQLEIGAAWLSASLPMRQPLGQTAMLFWQPAVQLAPGHRYGLTSLPVGAAFPLKKNLVLSVSAELSLESHLIWNWVDDGIASPFEPGYGASLGIHWQAPKKLGRGRTEKK